jgi:hypothetical protein
MMPCLAQFGGLDKLFIGCAVIGGVLFVVRLILQFMGADHSLGHDIGGGVDFHADLGGGAGHSVGAPAHDVSGSGHDAVGQSNESYLSFKILSFQGLTAFFMMFGLVGLAMMRQTEQGALLSLSAATAAGLGTVWVIGLLFRQAGTLQCCGNINLRNAIGLEGETYLTIPPDDIGKVRITIQERMRVYDAVAADKAEIKTGHRIRIVDVTPEDMLIVERIG